VESALAHERPYVHDYKSAHLLSSSPRREVISATPPFYSPSRLLLNRSHFLFRFKFYVAHRNFFSIISTMGSRPKRVGVIGAGVSGVTTAKYLLSSGLDVVVFERSKTAGGNW
jgi:hypothetical protein